MLALEIKDIESKHEGILPRDIFFPPTPPHLRHLRVSRTSSMPTPHRLSSNRSISRRNSVKSLYIPRKVNEIDDVENDNDEYENDNLYNSNLFRNDSFCSLYEPKKRNDSIGSLYLKTNLSRNDSFMSLYDIKMSRKNSNASSKYGTRLSRADSLASKSGINVSRSTSRKDSRYSVISTESIGTFRKILTEID